MRVGWSVFCARRLIALRVSTRFRSVREAFSSWVQSRALTTSWGLTAWPKLTPLRLFLASLSCFPWSLLPRDKACFFPSTSYHSHDQSLIRIVLGLTLTVYSLVLVLQRSPPAYFTSKTETPNWPPNWVTPQKTINLLGLLFLLWFISRSIKKGIFIYYLCWLLLGQFDIS